MKVLAQPVSVGIAFFEPPVIPAHRRIVHLLEEFTVAIGLIQFPQYPTQQRRLGDIRIHREGEVCDVAFIVDGVRDHAIGTLVIGHHADLILGQLAVDMAVCQRMEECIPLPDANVMDFGGNHCFSGDEVPGRDQSGAHHPPGVKILPPER